MKSLWTILIFINVFGRSISNVFEKICEEREKLLRQEIDMMLGSDVKLSDDEQKTNDIIMTLKHNEIDFGFKYPEHYNYSKHFFEYKDEVKKNKLFQIIKEMPKGAALHFHDTSFLGPDYVLQLTYMKHLYVCLENSYIKFLFAKDLPENPCTTKWQLMENARNSSSKTIKQFDFEMRKYFTLVVDNPYDEYKGNHDVWIKFGRYFMITESLFSYKPVWEQHFYDVLKSARDDNIMFLEIRTSLPPLYDLEGNKYDSVESAKSYKKVLDQFLQDYPDFIGAKLIYSPSRRVERNVVMDYIKTAFRLKQELPDFFAGFDLSNQEDFGKPNKEFLDILSNAKEHIDYFFHAGETNWYGFSSDEDLFDAVVLGAKRIGHGYAIIKHPLLIEEIKKRNIALEVNVVSNTVLKLVDDVRNHPLAAYLAQNLPVVISGDAPGQWEADPLSHDYYVTFVGVASRHADLRLLKKLALNSIYYSTYHDKDKIAFEFEIRWTNFIHKIKEMYGSQVL